jgi:enoyl-CoA hydratase/carnithine racemase
MAAERRADGKAGWAAQAGNVEIVKQHNFRAFTLSELANGVGLILFSRPPVNAVSSSVYEDIRNLCGHIEQSQSLRVIVLAAPEESRAWCGGADINDFVGMDKEQRKARYAFINASLPRFYELDRPVIAAINGATVGIGVILAGLCDLRVVAADANFSCPEIDFGLVGGGHGLFARLGLPEAKVREMLYTGRRFTAQELESTGFFNHVVARDRVLDVSVELANTIAMKSLPAIRARKRASNAVGGSQWMDGYLDAQARSADLVSSADSQEGVSAFLEGRVADLKDC